MKSKRNKIIIAAIFLIIVLGGGYLFSTKISKNTIKKTGYKTNHNPSYIDSMMRLKKLENQE